MKPGNLRLQGAKSGGGNRQMREMQDQCAPSPRRSVFLMQNAECIMQNYGIFLRKII